MAEPVHAQDYATPMTVPVPAVDAPMEPNTSDAPAEPSVETLAPKPAAPKRAPRPSLPAQKGTTVFPLARVAKIIKVGVPTYPGRHRGGHLQQRSHVPD